MRGRRRIVLLLLVACGLVAAGAFFIASIEPSYKGRTLDEWAEIYQISLYVGTALPQRREAEEAAHRLRKQALPRALKLIRSEQPQWKNQVARIMDLRLKASRWAPRFVWRAFYGEPGNRALVYFKMLGPDGSPAIPELEALATAPRTNANADRAVAALGAIGTNALPALLRITTNTQAKTRVEAVLQINLMGSNAAPAVPVLLTCLEDPDWRIAGNAAEILGRLALEPYKCVPALTNQIHHPHPAMRWIVMESLQGFGREAQAAVPCLLDMLNDRGLGMEHQARQALRKIAPETLGETNRVERQEN